MAPDAPAAVVNVQPAGNYVTRDVFDATINPIQADVSEIKGDVKVLLARDAGTRAVQTMLSRAGTLAVTVIAGSAGAVIAILFH